MSKAKSIKLSDLGSLGRNNTEILNALTGGTSLTPEDAETEIQKILNEHFKGYWKEVSVRYGQTAAGEMLQINITVPVAKFNYSSGYPLDATVGQIRQDLENYLRR